MKLWLVRHAQAQVEPGVCYGSLDVPPDPGATATTARALATTLPPGLVLVSSPLQRCERLAQHLSGLRPDLTLRIDPHLAEMDFGGWEGLRWEEIGEPAVRAWTLDFAHHRPGGGESVSDFLARVEQALLRARAGGGPCAWITHAGVIRAVSLLAAGHPAVSRADQWPRDAVPPGHWKVVRI